MTLRTHLRHCAETTMFFVAIGYGAFCVVALVGSGVVQAIRDEMP
jgi:hypothetical protein